MLPILSDKTHKSDKLLVVFGGLLFFLINPTIATIMILSFMFIVNRKDCAPWAVVILLIYIWCFQSTRSFALDEPMDWANGYYVLFNQVGSVSTIEYIKGEGREYVWQIINLIGHFVFNGEFLPFAFFIVFLTYLLTFLSIYNYWKESCSDLRTLLTSLVLIAFFSEFIMVINNLLRQQFAFSIMLYVFVRKITTGNINWFLLCCAFLTHTMVALFVPFLFINIKQRFKTKQYILLVCCFLALYILFSNLSLFAGVGLYVFQRLATGADHLGDVIDVSAIYPFLAVMLIFYVKAFWIDKHCGSNRMFFNNLMIVLLAVCLLMTPMPLMQTRYYILRLFLMPFILPYFFRTKLLSTIYQSVVCLLFVIRFFSYDYLWFDVDDVLLKTFFQFDLLG